MQYHFTIFKEKYACWAKGIEIPGCHVQAETKPELVRNIYSALLSYLGSHPDIPPPSRQPKSSRILVVTVEPHVALGCALRRTRLLRQFSQEMAAKKAGFRNLAKYRLLESGQLPDLGFETLIRIKRVFPELKIDDALAA